VTDYGLQLRTLPDAPADLFHVDHIGFDLAISEAVKLANEARAIYWGDLHMALFELLQQSIVLPYPERLTFWNALAKFVQSETRDEPRRKQLGMLHAIVMLAPSFIELLELSDQRRPDTAPELAPLTVKWQQVVIDELKRSLRRWALIRPWRWKLWYTWEREIRGTHRQLAKEGV
jgi:hypothetical protein